MEIPSHCLLHKLWACCAFFETEQGLIINSSHSWNSQVLIWTSINSSFLFNSSPLLNSIIHFCVNVTQLYSIDIFFTIYSTNLAPFSRTPRNAIIILNQASSGRISYCFIESALLFVCAPRGFWQVLCPLTLSLGYGKMDSWILGWTEDCCSW